MARPWWQVDRRAVLVTALCIVVWRLLLHIPVTDIPARFIENRLELFGGSGFFVAIGPRSNPFGTDSIALIGIGPYINALIILSMLRVISERADALIRDDPSRVQRWARPLAVLLAIGQAYGWTVLAQSEGILPLGIDWFIRLVICLQVAAGTMALVFLAEIVDEYGLGFGNAALLLYALGPLVSELRRIASYFATTPSVEALYRPVALAAAFTIVTIVATLALLLAVGRVPAAPAKRHRHEKSTPLQLRLLESGVIRPPLFAVAVMFVPTIAANYVAINSDLSTWIQQNWTPRGPNVWTDVLYIAIEVALVAGFAIFVVAADLRWKRQRADIVKRISRLTFIGGTSLGLLVFVMPALEEAATSAAGQVISVSGFSIVLAVTMIVITVRILEGRPLKPLATSSTYLP